MLVSLIPFFLVARLAVDESVWNYGPEYVFDMEMNVTSAPMNRDDIQKMNYTFAKLFCRPKGPDCLACRLKNVKTQNLDVTNNNQLDIHEGEKKHEITEEPFVVKFNEYGIDYLIVDEDLQAGDLNTIKNIVSLLSIGADLNGKSDGAFEIAENTTVGLCNVTFEINHSPVRGVFRKMHTELYELESLPSLNKVPGETVDIEKTTDLDDCSNYAPFYHGTYGENVVVDTDLSSHLKSSVSRIFVADTRFVSVLTRKGSMGYSPYDYAITEKIMLTLQNIQAASGPEPMIARASKTMIMANADVERIYNMK